MEERERPEIRVREMEETDIRHQTSERCDTVKMEER